MCVNMSETQDNRKKVIVELSIKIITDVPVDWSEHDIEFWLNGSSHCLENEFAQVAEEMEYNDKVRPNTCCVCQRASGKYIRDVMDEDDYSEFGYIEENKKHLTIPNHPL